MGPGGGMCLLAVLAFSSGTSLAANPDRKLEVMSAPNLLRVGTAENIFVEIQDCNLQTNVQVQIKVLSFPTKNKEHTKTSVTLTSGNDYQALASVTIPSDGFSKNPEVKQHVYLQAIFPTRTLEKIVMVSFQAGYIFIQTDKTLYTPNSNIDYRVFAVTPDIAPVERGTSTEDTISVEVKTPENIIAKTSLIHVESGIYTGFHKLGEIVSHGVWKLVAKFSSNPQHSFTAEFEVKEYVLPSFEVTVTPSNPFYYVDSNELSVQIQAKYLFGEPVNGVAYVIFGLIESDGVKKSFPDSLQKVQITGGEGRGKLRREHITALYRDVLTLKHKSIYISVSVLTEDGGEMVEAELKGIKIVESPYTIRFTKTSQYFKPRISFDVAVEVLNPDGSPAVGVAVLVNDVVPGITASNGIARLSVNSEASDRILKIKAKTNKPNLPTNRQATATMDALPHTTKKNYYIHIGVNAAELINGQSLTFTLNVKYDEGKQVDITWLVLSRGRLVKKSRYRINSPSVISQSFIVTKDMLPSLRIIAYYHTDDKEVIADSVMLDAKISCMGSLKLQPSTPATSYQPASNIGLKVTGDPGAKVGLVAVDKGVYVLNNQFRLTQKKVWDTIEKYDTGCTPGGGKDSMGVFYDAGLLFESSAGPGTAIREDLNCPVSPRRKRATTITDVRTSLASQYKNDLERECCLDGMRDIPLSYSCQRRSSYIQDGQACVDAFLQCCNEMVSIRADKRVEELQLARSEEDDGYIDSNSIVTRTSFPESWLWTVIDLPPCESGTCEPSMKEVTQRLKDSITTWQFTGISLSKTHGICVSDPLDVIVWKKFFIVLKVPYSAVTGEQVEIRAILHNYRKEASSVRVDLLEETHLCSAAYKKSRYRQEVVVGPETTRSVPFVIIPMKDGIWNIRVQAAVKGLDLTDGVQGKLRVVPQGVLKKTHKILILDPARRGGTQRELINSQIDVNDLVPGSDPNTQIFVTGREQMNALLENAVSGNSLGTLIQEPAGCGEQNMIGMTLPVTAAMYLDRTKQWTAVGVAKREEAINHIQTGYQNQLSFRKSDGSFAMYPWRDSTTWLTAYVAKVFSIASNIVGGQNSLICDAVKFLILHAQLPDGMFREIGEVYMKSMISDVEGTDSDASMTAFCLIAMQESRSICTRIDSLQRSIDKAVAYLERRLPRLTNPYAVTMTSYALANENKLNKRILLNFASSGTHWPTPLGHVYTLEATAYALLALVKAKAKEEAKIVVGWLKQQQQWGGGYGSTQATIMVYQALAEYWSSTPEPEYSLNVDLRLPGRDMDVRYHFNSRTLDTKSDGFKNINTDVTVTATGNGTATLSMVSLYYILPESMESECLRFDLSIDVESVKIDPVENVYKLTIKVKFKDSKRKASMSILDVGLPTGFVANTNDLDLLSKGHARTISKYELNNTALAYRGSIFIYLDYISNTEPEEISFRIHQKLTGNVLQPAAVSVYEYYDRTHCVKFYNPQRKSGGTMRSCGEAECTCADESCSMQKKEGVSDAERTAKACEHTKTNVIDYVYKIQVTEIVEDLSRDLYKVKVLETIKEGNFDAGSEGKERIFFSFPHCKQLLDMKKDKTYLVMGTSKDIYKDERTQSFRYSLGERTWLEYWPTESEGQTDKYRSVYLGMEELKSTYQIFQCDL